MHIKSTATLALLPLLASAYAAPGAEGLPPPVAGEITSSTTTTSAAPGNVTAASDSSTTLPPHGGSTTTTSAALEEIKVYLNDAGIPETSWLENGTAVPKDKWGSKVATVFGGASGNNSDSSTTAKASSTSKSTGDDASNDETITKTSSVGTTSHTTSGGAKPSDQQPVNVAASGYVAWGSVVGALMVAVGFGALL